MQTHTGFEIPAIDVWKKNKWFLQRTKSNPRWKL